MPPGMTGPHHAAGPPAVQLLPRMRPATAAGPTAAASLRGQEASAHVNIEPSFWRSHTKQMPRQDMELHITTSDAAAAAA